MSAFIARRLVESALVLLAVSFVVYALIGLMPGDPIDLMLQADPYAHLRPTRPPARRWRGSIGRWWSAGSRWLGAAVQGDFGYSRLYAVPAMPGAWARVWSTRCC